MQFIFMILYKSVNCQYLGVLLPIYCTGYMFKRGDLVCIFLERFIAKLCIAEVQSKTPGRSLSGYQIYKADITERGPSMIMGACLCWDYASVEWGEKVAQLTLSVEQQSPGVELILRSHVANVSVSGSVGVLF